MILPLAPETNEAAQGVTQTASMKSSERKSTMNMNQISQSINISDARLHIIRDMILLALDATETLNLPEANRLEARAALAEALDVMEEVAQ